MSQQVVYKMPLKHDEEILFMLKEFKGNWYFDMRIFFQSQKDGTMLPSKKGLTLGVGLFEEFRKGVDRLSEVVTENMTTNA